MRILQLANKFPFPLKDGGAIATFNLTKSFSKLGNDVTLLAMNTSKHHYDLKYLPAEIKKSAKFIAVGVNNNISAVSAFFSLLKNESYNVQRFISEKYNDKLIELLHEQEFDLIQLEGLYLSPYVETIRSFSHAKISMRAHNVEHLIWQHIAKNEKNTAKKFYLKILSKQLKKYELRRLNKYDFLIPISNEDEKKFKELGCEIPMHVCPASFDEEIVKPDKSKEGYPSVFFIGALDWIPNVEGLNWFIESVWRKITGSYPEIKFHIAGRNCPEELKRRKETNMIVHGEVENANDFMNSKSIMVVPLFSGSGMRVKIIEAMALGKTIVSTSIGAEGIDCEDEKNILIADDEKKFAENIFKCAGNKPFSETIGNNAMKFAHQNFSAEQTTKTLLNFYHQNKN